MRKMKDSGVAWIGEIPSTWTFEKLKNFFTFEKGINAQDYTKEYIGSHQGDFPVYSGQTENDGIMGTIDSFDYDIQKCIFTTTVGAKVMSAKIISGKFSLSQNCLIMKPINTSVVVEFFFYVLIALFEYEKSLIPTYMQPSLRISDLLKYSFFIPKNFMEQKKIASYLDAKCAEIDHSMELVRQGVDKLKEYKKFVITEAVTKGLDTDVPMKDSGVPWIGEVPVEWELIRLKFIAPVQGGYSFKSEKFSKEHGIPLVRMNNLKRGQLNLEDSVKIQKEDIVEDFFINENDILIGLSGSIGDTGSLGNYAVASKDDLPCLLNQRVGRFTVSKSISYKLIVYFLDTDFFKQPLILDSNGTAQFNISPSDIGEVLVPLPPFSTQQDIIAYLSSKCAEIDTLIAQKQALLDKLAEYKKSLIFECVTGKREVAA